MSAKPVCISYLRFSRPEQLKGDSIRRQLTLGEQWAAAHGLTIADSFRDLGVSAYRGRNAAEGNLSRLLKLVDSGKIPKGSVLLIEQLDRLSRNALLEALELFLSIIRRGIKIVTLMDGMEYDRESLNRNMMGLQYSLMQMSLAHEESAKKAERLAHAWVGKRAKIKEKPLTRQLPAWLKIEGGKIVIDEEKAAVVRRMVKLALDGHGLGAITQKMNAEFQGLARVKYFQRSYVFKILHSRALIGEFQPHRNVFKDGKKSREPVGEPIHDYYPALLNERAFYAVQKQLASRHKSGGPRTQFVNLFQGTLFDANDGTTFQLQNKGPDQGRRYSSAGSILGLKGASKYISFPVQAFEQAFLWQFHDQFLPAFMKQDDDGLQGEIDALEGRIAELDRKVEKIQQAMLDAEAENVTSVVGMLAKLDAQRKQLVAKLDDLRHQQAANSLGRAKTIGGAAVALIEKHKAGGLTNDERTELRGIIKQVVERIDAAFSRESLDYICDAKVTLRSGETFPLIFAATHINTMKRNRLGHPIKSKGPKGPPQYGIDFHPASRRHLLFKTDRRGLYMVQSAGDTEPQWVDLNEKPAEVAQPPARARRRRVKAKA